MSLSNIIFGTEGMQYEHTSDKRLPFGARMVFPDGREFVYGQAGGTALTTATLVQQAVVTTGHTKDLVVAASAAIGATSVTVTNSTTAITANMYAEGHLFVNDAGGEGYMYIIKSHPAESTGSGTCVFTLEEGSALRVAVTITTSEVGLRKHLCDEVVVAPTTFTGALVGVAVRAMTENYYGWFLTKGAAPILTNGTVIVGRAVSRSATTAGAVDTYPVTLSEGTPNTYTTNDHLKIGTVMSVGGTTEYSLVNFNIN